MKNGEIKKEELERAFLFLLFAERSVEDCISSNTCLLLPDPYPDRMRGMLKSCMEKILAVREYWEEIPTVH